MKRALPALFACLAGAAHAQDCPQSLGDGLRLATADQRYSVEYRPADNGALLETRRDTRPETSVAFRYFETRLQDGLVMTEVLAPVPFGRDFDGAITPRAALAQSGSWQAEAVSWIQPGSAPNRIEIDRETHRLTRGDTQSVAIGPCRYDAWVLTRHVTVTEPLYEPQRKPGPPQISIALYAPDLGVIVQRDEYAPEDGSFRGVLKFDTIERLD